MLAASDIAEASCLSCLIRAAVVGRKWEAVSQLKWQWAVCFSALPWMHKLNENGKTQQCYTITVPGPPSMATAATCDTLPAVCAHGNTVGFTRWCHFSGFSMRKMYRSILV